MIDKFDRDLIENDIISKFLDFGIKCERSRIGGFIIEFEDPKKEGYYITITNLSKSEGIKIALFNIKSVYVVKVETALNLEQIEKILYDLIVNYVYSNN